MVRALSLLLTMLLAGCVGEQHVLQATGIEAQVIARMWWIMVAGAIVVLALVVAVLGYGLFRPPERRVHVAAGPLIFGGGVVLPVVALTALLSYTLYASSGLRGAHPDLPVEIEVIGRRWWWDVHYVGEDPARHFRTANELYLPTGSPTRIRVRSVDVIHSFWVPNLAGKIDLLPGRSNEIVLHPTTTGVSRGQCAEYCGAQHANMALHVLALEPEAYRAWLERQRQPAAEPAEPFTRLGREVFMRAACAYCHAVRGSHAGGLSGPDLTHVGSRRWIAAGMLPTTRGSLAGWIAHAQQIKPGNLMPSFAAFSGEELRALAAYMESLQ